MKDTYFQKNHAGQCRGYHPNGTMRKLPSMIRPDCTCGASAYNAVYAEGKRSGEQRHPWWKKLFL